MTQTKEELQERLAGTLSGALPKIFAEGSNEEEEIRKAISAAFLGCAYSITKGDGFYDVSVCAFGFVLHSRVTDHRSGVRLTSATELVIDACQDVARARQWRQGDRSELERVIASRLDGLANSVQAGFCVDEFMIRVMMGGEPIYTILKAA